MSRETENQGFVCVHCGTQVSPVDSGSYRNHCPACLYSVHLDDLPGDRMNSCRGLMEPVGLLQHSKKGYQIIHMCLRCKSVVINRAVREGTQPDDLDVLIKLPII